MKRTLLLAAVALLLSAGAAQAATVLITGSNRGLGLEFARQYAARGDTVIATARNPADAKDLNALAAENKNILIEKLDVLDPAQIKALAAKYKGKPIDILINNAGVLGSGAFGNLDKAEFDRVMETNAFAPLAVTEALLENVKASQLKKIVALTTPGATFNTKSLVQNGKRAGAPEPGKEVTGKRDVTVSEGGGFYYSLSKVALNMAVHKIRPELKKDGIVFGLIAPILVDTDMLAEFGFSGPRTSAPDAVANFIKIIDGMTVETTGKPVAHDGTILDW